MLNTVLTLIHTLSACWPDRIEQAPPPVSSRPQQQPHLLDWTFSVGSRQNWYSCFHSHSAWSVVDIIALAFNYLSKRLSPIPDCDYLEGWDPVILIIISHGLQQWLAHSCCSLNACWLSGVINTIASNFKGIWELLLLGGHFSGFLLRLFYASMICTLSVASLSRGQCGNSKWLFGKLKQSDRVVFGPLDLFIFNWAFILHAFFHFLIHSPFILQWYQQWQTV